MHGERQYDLINTHVHLFTTCHLPSRMFILPVSPRRLVDNRVGKGISHLLQRALKWAWPLSSGDFFDRVAAFLTIGNRRTQKEVFDELTASRSYPRGTVFVVLPLDFEPIGAGTCQGEYSYAKQLEELATLRDTVNGKGDFCICPFVAVDPRREGEDAPLARARHFIENRGFCGIKIYPTFGYFPYDSNLLPLYDYAIENDIPVVGHAMPATPLVHTRRLFCARDLVKRAFPERLGYFDLPWSVASYFAHPKSYEELLRIRPTLKLCLAHSGDIARQYPFPVRSADDNWFDQVETLLRNQNYPNLFVDIGYSATTDLLLSRVTRLLDDDLTKNKVLFGTDFYMNTAVTIEEGFFWRLKHDLGDTRFRQMASTNPKRYLGKSIAKSMRDPSPCSQMAG